MTVNPVTLAVISGRLQETADEMDEVLCNAAFSPTISEGRDMACGIYKADSGNVIAQGTNSMQVFIETMQHCAKAILDEAEGRGGLSPGDVIIRNDPYVGGSHLMDVKIFRPYFRDGKLLYLLGSTGHWPDIGGSTPGGFVAGATQVYQEGIRIPYAKIYRAGELNEDLLNVLLANIRTPEERLGDFNAQIGALKIGEKRLDSLLDEYGESLIQSCIAELEDRAEVHMRSYISEMCEGVYSYTDYFDNDGVEDKPIAITVDLRVEGSGICFDFSRSDPPVKGAMNGTYSVVASACVAALRHIFPDVPLNAGILRAIEVVAPKTTLLNASFPMATAGCAAEVSWRVSEAVFGALAQVIPDQLWAGAFGTSLNLAIGGEDSSFGPYVMYLFTGGGLGAYKGGDGLTYGAPPMGMAKQQPYEVFEQLYPLRTRRFCIRNGSGGIGQYVGGYGATIEFEFLGEQARLSLFAEKGKFGPRGMLGGKEGARTEFCIIRGNGQKYTLSLSTKGETNIFKGDIIQIKTPGGGGYGNPRERPYDKVIADIAQGFVAREVAEREFGISVTEMELERARLTL